MKISIHSLPLSHLFLDLAAEVPPETVDPLGETSQLRVAQLLREE